MKEEEGCSLLLFEVYARITPMRKLKIFNSYTNQIEEFVPLKEGKASLYVCGPTVYNSPHIGNFRPVITFDVLRRLLIAIGYDVTFVSNYTDVDDKIINRAKELGISEKQLTESVIGEFASLVKECGSMLPDITPKPTVYMEQMISYINDLIEKGAAYVTKSGDVYFRVSSVEEYGHLSGNSVEDLVSGARIESSSEKESPLDFALWKKTEDGIRWDTKWCSGRPGWHTECCVMIDSIFRDQDGLIDIHGGGFDLKFPHHENEIAQARAHNHNQLARYWMHNGFININNEKMSKSLGNVLLAKDVFALYGGLSFRLMVLNAHYRAPVSFSEETILEAQKNVAKLSTAYKQLAVALQTNGVSLDKVEVEGEERFYEVMCEDLNTPNALSILYEEVKNANQLLRKRPLELDALKASFQRLSDYFFVLGLPFAYPTLSEEDKKVYEEYNELKKQKRFEESDKLRAILQEKGIL